MEKSAVEAWAIYSTFCAVYLGQALWAYFGASERWIARALLFLNQWAGVVEAGVVLGALAAIVKLLWLSKGHLGASISGLAWSGPPAHEGEVFAGTFVVTVVAAGVLLARAPARSVITHVALFFGPGLLAAIAVGGWVVLVAGAVTR
jgi:hypothetical protein